jgi:hypothetical protein
MHVPCLLLRLIDDRMCHLDGCCAGSLRPSPARQAAMSWNDPLAGHPRYASLRTISKGPRGVVQLAVDRMTGEQVAIKFTMRGEQQLNSRLQQQQQHR